MSDIVTFSLPEGVSKDDVKAEADDLGYASVNQYLMDIFKHRDESGEGSRMDRFERQLKNHENRIDELEDRIDDVETNEQ